jgi:hypothetical protein
MAEPEENYSAEAEATSRDPHDWGRAMALAVTRLAEQLAPEGSPDIHASLLGRDLLLRIRDDPAGVTITVSSEAGPGGSGPGRGADEPAGHAAG